MIGAIAISISLISILYIVSIFRFEEVPVNGNKETAQELVLRYLELVQDGRIREAIDTMVFYTEEHSETMESLRNSWQDPDEFKVEILGVNKINNNLYQVITRVTYLDIELESVSDMYSLFTGGEWRLVLNPFNIPYTYSENLIIERWDPNAIFPDEVMILP